MEAEAPERCSGEAVIEALGLLEVRTAATAVDEDEVEVEDEDGPSSMLVEDEISLAGVSTTTGTSRSPPLGMAAVKVLCQLSV